MKLIHPSIAVHTPDYDMALRTVGMAAKICYGKSLKDATPRAELEQYIKARLDAGHESVIEHINVSVLITTCRQVTHELVRHRLCSFTQSSTRYIDETKDGGETTLVIPSWSNLKPGVYDYNKSIDFSMKTIGELFNADYVYDQIWLNSCLVAEYAYRVLSYKENTPEVCANILANNKAATILITANLREWRHILALRAKGTTGRPHPQMRQIMYPIWMALHDRMPVFFETPDKPLFDIPGTENVEVLA